MVLKQIFTNKYFLIVFTAWLVAQIIKVIITLIIDKKLNLTRLIGSGGMPSSHSAVVMSLTTALGLDYGWESVYFMISFIFSLVIMYDASGVRRAVGKQAIILNTMLEDLYEHKRIKEEKLKELIGHTPYEVVMGAILGIIIANFMI